MLDSLKLESWNENGFLLLENLFTKEEVNALVSCVDDIAVLEPSPGKWMQYHETSLLDNQQILGRVECFLEYHKGIEYFLLHETLMTTISEIIGGPAILFKEKINFKLPGANGYPPHQDAPAWRDFPPGYFISAFVAVDACDISNGCMQMYPRRGILELSGEINIPQEEWISIKMKPGDVLFFDCFVVHKSEPNLSDYPRRALLNTYNRRVDGDFRTSYFENKRKFFPPMNERLSNVDYANNPYNHFNPFK